MKQKFTIIWVEDKPRAMKSQIDEIKEYLESKNFDPEVIEDEDGKQLKAAIKSGKLIDIVVTDKNLTEEISGLDILNLLKDKKIFTDVLFYSAAKGFDKDEVYNQHYGFVEVIEGKEKVIGPLKKIVDKNIRRCEDIVFLRGMVISMIIDMELKVNEFFAKYFQIPLKTMEHFHSFILENKFNSLAGKKSTLSKILKGNKIEKEFEGLGTQISDLIEERNLLAHCKIDPHNKNTLISMGEKEVFNKARITKILTKLNKVSEHLDRLIQKFLPKTK